MDSQSTQNGAEHFLCATTNSKDNYLKTSKLPDIQLSHFGSLFSMLAKIGKNKEQTR